MTDPFATDTPADPWAEPQRPTTTTQDVADVHTDQNYVTVILKGGRGYGAPSVSIRGASISDALAQVKSQEAALKELLQISARYGTAYGRLVDGDAPQGGQSNGGGQQRQQSGGRPGEPANAKSKPDYVKQEYCAHGAMTWNAGFKDGKAWGGHFCPLPKGAQDKCDPVWAKLKG